MKKIAIISSLLFFIGNYSIAQTNVYHPFPDSGMIWNMRISGSECSNCYKRSYFISGDTLISTIACHKINYYETIGISIAPWYHCEYPFTNTMEFYGGAIHQDTILKKVYLFLPGSNTDTLLYDFSLGIGDTLPVGFNNHINPILYVDQIDSVLIGSTYRKRFLIPSAMNGIIEGIGSTTGLFEDLTVFECGGLLECVSQYGQTIYPDTLSPCDLMDALKEVASASSFKINFFPNPVIDRLTVSSPQFAISSIEIYNSLGTRVYFSTDNSTSCIVNCSSFPTGIYFVKATSKEKTYFKKFIRE
jgi:hypothetical protein